MEYSASDSSDLAFACPISNIPSDPLSVILSLLPLRDAVACRAVCRLLRDALSPPYPPPVAALRLLALRGKPDPTREPGIHALDPTRGVWIRIPLPSPSFLPVAAAGGNLVLCSLPGTHPNSLIACNPITGAHRQLPDPPAMGHRRAAVLGGASGAAVLLTELAVISFNPCAGAWVKTPRRLPSKPRSPILTGDAIYVLCNVAGVPWRTRWRLFTSSLSPVTPDWSPIERPMWGDVLDVLHRPRLLSSAAPNRFLMAGGLRASYGLEGDCSAAVILRLDLNTMEWEEAGRMPAEMYDCYYRSGGKTKAIGGEGMILFLGEGMNDKKLALWEEGDGESGRWKWVDAIPGHSNRMCGGFVFDAALIDSPGILGP